MIQRTGNRMVIFTGTGIKKVSKTRISHTLNYHQGNCGFDFLGFQVRQFPVGKTHSGKMRPYGQTPILLGYKTIISPGNEAQKRRLVLGFSGKGVKEDSQPLVDYLRIVLVVWEMEDRPKERCL